MEHSTRGLSRHGHPEFILTCADDLGSDLAWLCGVLEEMVASGRAFRPGETFQLGWSVLMVRNASAGRLSLWELDHSGVAGRLDCSVTRSLVALRRQKGVLASFGLESQAEIPSLKQTAVRCTRFPSAAERLLSRSEGTSADSGWFFGCTDKGHDHDLAENLTGGPLYEMVCANVMVIDFLAMPVGSIILLDQSGRIRRAFGPGGAKLRIEAGSYLHLKEGKPM